MTSGRRASWIPVVASVVLSAISLSGCGEESFHDVGPNELGEIQYDLDLTGSPAEGTDPFRIRYVHQSIDASRGEPFTAEFLPRTLDNVPAGPVEVELSETPSNCSVEDGTRVVTVEVDAPVEVTFTVACD